MNDIQRCMLKVAAEKSLWERTKKKVKRFVGGIGSGRVKKTELRKIEGQLKQMRPKTEKEKKIERLTGRRWTPGQYARGAAIGAGVGTVGHVIGSAIEGAGKGKFKSLVAPRRIARTAAIASLYGAALPAARRIADVEAAKRGKF